MTFSTEDTQASSLKKSWASSFRRIQIALGFWGVLLLVAGWLHNANARAWGSVAILLMWAGIMVLGLVGTYLITNEALASGMFFIWIFVVALAFGLSWLIIFPLGGNGSQLLAPIWHSAFVGGYVVNGYFMDRRLFWLAGWEAVVLVFMLLVNFKVLLLPNITGNQGLVFGLTGGLPLIIAALPIWKER